MLYYLFFNKDAELIGQTTDSQTAKLYKSQLKNDSIKFQRLKVNLSREETLKVRNFLSMNLVDMSPYSEKIYPEIEVDSYTYYINNLTNDTLENINTLARKLTAFSFTDEEYQIILDYFTRLDYMSEDLNEYYEDANACAEDYFDMDYIMKSIKEGKLTL